MHVYICIYSIYKESMTHSKEANVFEHRTYMHAFVHVHTNMHTYVKSMTHSEEANVFEHRAHGPQQLSHPLKVATVSVQPPTFC